GRAAPAVPIPEDDAAEPLRRRAFPHAPERFVAAALLAEVDDAARALVPRRRRRAADRSIPELGEDDRPPERREPALELDAAIAPTARHVVDRGGVAGLDEREVATQPDDVDEIPDGDLAIVVPVARVPQRAAEHLPHRRHRR